MGQPAQLDNTTLGTPLPPPAPAPEGAFAPLRYPVFRDRWIASAVSNIGTWMQDTAGTWLMAVLTTSPLLIALMQTAASLPVLLLGLIAGATADIYERRRLLIFWQTWQLVSVAILSVLTFAGIVSPVTLLVLTFLLNIGSAMNNPAWQAIVPELVPRDQVPNAVALNAASNNLARAVGPALGGLMVAAFLHPARGAAWTFTLNSASFAGVIWILYRWHRTPLFRSALPAERIAGSMRTGLRYLRYSPELRAPMVRGFCFTFFVASVWSLLAVVARQDLKQGALGYGILNGSLGLGAVIGATSLARLRTRFPPRGLLAATSLWYLFAFLVLGLVRVPGAVIATLIVSGFCWTTTMATLNTSVQLTSPNWVQARALGLYQMIAFGGLALGSVAWGAVAQHFSTSTAYLCAAVGMAVSLPFTLRIPVLTGTAPDLSPHQWKHATPQTAAPPDPSAGPVRIVIRYNIEPANYAQFSHVVHELEGVRLRLGAVRWGIWRYVDEPERVEETFLMESWLDFLRSRERMTAADYTIRERVLALHTGDAPHAEYQVYVRELSPELAA